MPSKQPIESITDPWAGYADKTPEERLRILYDAYREARDADKTQFFAGRMLECTVDMDEHPEWFDCGCACSLCCSYG